MIYYDKSNLITCIIYYYNFMVKYVIIYYDNFNSGLLMILKFLS